MKKTNLLTVSFLVFFPFVLDASDEEMEKLLPISNMQDYHNDPLEQYRQKNGYKKITSIIVYNEALIKVRFHGRDEEFLRFEDGEWSHFVRRFKNKLNSV